jgi:hypothetical protein
MPEPIEYAGAGTIASWCGVTGAAVSNWLVRYSDCPQPAVVVQAGDRVTYGWAMDSKQEWLEWLRPKPKRLRPGLRPRNP